RVEALRDPGRAAGRLAPEDTGPVAARPLHHRVDWGWRMASFSALTGDRPDHDGVHEPAPGDDPATEHTIFTFPGGARAGTCLHAILERLDFAERDSAHRRDVAARELRRAGFAPEWLPVVEDMLERVLSTPLDPPGRIRLLGVPRARRLDELEFTYPLAGFDVAGLRTVLSAHGFSEGAFAASLDALAFRHVSGFMRGFIDLVFEADGKYWLVDYKSNWLGTTLEDYRADRLPAVMARETYWLQYLIYVVVLHRLLRMRLPGYDYDTHVGGVLYLFLRGMTPALGSGSGVFHDRPSRALVEELDRWIGGGR